MVARFVGCVIAALVGALGCSGSDSASPSTDAEPVTFAELVTDYTALDRLTAEPIEFEDFGICGIPVRGRETPVHTDYGQIHVYGNELSRAPMAQTGPRSFPDGSVIVKEKLTRTGSGAGIVTELSGLGMMVKRGTEWGYAFWEADELYENLAELDLCRQCHLTGEVPAGLAELWDLAEVPERIYVEAPRDSVFLTLPAPAVTTAAL